MIKMDPDQTARYRIRNEVDKNFFVEAGAGSGKTTLLVDRMVEMVRKGYDVSKISAITFTKAAANEFYERFQKKLSEKLSSAALSSNATQELKLERENIEKALKDIDLCFMGTIDSFCQMIISEHPMEAGVPSNATVKSDEEMNALYRQVYSDIQKGVYGPDLKKKCLRVKHYFYNAEAIFLDGMKFMMGTKNAELQFDKPKDETLDEIFKKEIAGVTEAFRNLYDHPEFIDDDGKGTAKAKERFLH